MAIGKKGKAADGPRVGGALTVAQRVLVKVLCYTPVIPAVWVNLESSAVGFVAAGNVASAIGAAAFLDAAVHNRKGRFVSLLMIVGFVVCFAYNLTNGLANISKHSAATTDSRRGEINQASRLQAQMKELDVQLADLAKRRDAQDAKAGGKSPDEIEGELQALTSGSPFWHRSKECANATVGESQAFCNSVGVLKAKKAAAAERMRLDGERKDVLDQRKRLNDKIDTAGAPPAAADEFAASVESVAGVLGYSLSESQKASVRPMKDLLWAVVLEVVAALGPVALSLLLGAGHSEPKVEEPVPAKEAPRAQKTALASIKSAASIVRKLPAPVEAGQIAASNTAIEAEETDAKTDAGPGPDWIEAFMADKLEECQGSYIDFKEMWALAQEWCRDKGQEPGSSKAFSKASKPLMQWESNNKRPRYANVKRRELRALRLAVSNS